MTSLIPIQNLPRRSTLDVREIRDEMSNYFMNEGKIPWQNKYAYKLNVFQLKKLKKRKNNKIITVFNVGLGVSLSAIKPILLKANHVLL